MSDNQPSRRARIVEELIDLAIEEHNRFAEDAPLLSFEEREARSDRRVELIRQLAVEPLGKTRADFDPEHDAFDPEYEGWEDWGWCGVLPGSWISPANYLDRDMSYRVAIPLYYENGESMPFYVQTPAGDVHCGEVLNHAAVVELLRAHGYPEDDDTEEDDRHDDSIADYLRGGRYD